MENFMLRECILSAFFSVTGLSAAHADQAIVLELFTSQGCSSCPPADMLLEQLAAEDSRLLPLSFHVDYWDHLGWKDPYSSPYNTERQRGYASRLDGQVYTPELVVNGAAGVVGSDESVVRAAITSSQRGTADIQIATTADHSRLEVVVAGRKGLGD
jgi:hypothetical protein